MTRLDHEKNNKKSLIAKRLNEPGLAPRSQQADTRLLKPDDLLRGKALSLFQKQTNANYASMDDLCIAYQRIACSSLLELGRHRNITIVRNMFNNTPPFIRDERMEKFLTAYGQVVSVRDDFGRATLHFSREKKLHLGLALEQPWWRIKP